MPDSAPDATQPAVVRGLRRWLFLIAGFASLGIAGVGVIVPLLPTTPLVLLAAYCFARSSPRMHQRLLDNRVFGPLIKDWSGHRSVPLRAKILAVSMIVVFGGLAIILVDFVWAKIALAALFIGVITWLLTRTTSRPPTSDTVSRA